MTSYILAAQHLSKEVLGEEGSLCILNDVSLQLASGDSLAITGTSGSGKSTLLGLLAGLDLPTQGDVLLAGQSLNALNEDERAQLRGRMAGFVFQSFQLLDNLNALENVMLPLELEASAQAQQQATELLKQVGLGQRLHHYPRQLSGGEQQRVALARAFATQPAILFADEPTGNLDRHTGNHISDLLFSMNQEYQTTLVLVTHDEHLAQRCQKQLRLEAGMLVHSSECAS